MHNNELQCTVMTAICRKTNHWKSIARHCDTGQCAPIDATIELNNCTVDNFKGQIW